MPRKQRFKPSRKQPSQQQEQSKVENKQEDVHSNDVSVENEVPSRGQSEDSDVEGHR